MFNARLRITKPNSVDPDGTTIITITGEDQIVTCQLPIADFAYALMGVSGIDCELEVKGKE